MLARTHPLSSTLKSQFATAARASASWMDEAWLPLAAVMAAIVGVLNAGAVHLFHTIEKHVVFRERILHGFSTADVVPGYPIPPTFPMWGYGWVLLLTTNTIALVVLQMAVALATAWYFCRVVTRAGMVNRWSRMLLQLLIVLCTPWYAYHSIAWSHSLATSFLVLSLALLIAASSGQGAPGRLIALSAICFGLNLNFASDLYLLPFAMAAAGLLVARCPDLTVAHSLAWLAGIGLMLVPWMIYSWHATGTPLIKSTNQGHVLFIGLGQDPQQRFGITYSDVDPTMYRIVRERAGDAVARRFYGSCSFEADRVLTRAFVQIVRQQPRAYLDLVQIKLVRVVSGGLGTYNGEFDEGANAGRFGIPQPIRQRVARYTARVGRYLQLGTTCLAPLVVVAAVWRRQPAWAFILVPIAYQYLSCSVGVVQPQYVANLILLQVLVCAHGVGLLLSRFDTLRH
jgi:hypothetical protein